MSAIEPFFEDRSFLPANVDLPVDRLWLSVTTSLKFPRDLTDLTDSVIICHTG